MPNLKFLASIVRKIWRKSQNFKSRSRNPFPTPYDLILHFILSIPLIHSISPWAQRPLVSNALFTTCLHSRRSWAILLRVCISMLHQSLTSSSHSLLGLPRTDVPSTIPNITFFTSLWSSILHMCPNKLSFLSMMSWMILLVLPTRLLTSSFVILCCHFRIRLYSVALHLSRQQTVLVPFPWCPRFTSIHQCTEHIHSLGGRIRVTWPTFEILGPPPYLGNNRS